ncbi:MAG TPA: energy transducer TonB [Halalkalibaculum sp.]|nr:energy transducer TonB [Halalkalibaculum sp.]
MNAAANPSGRRLKDYYYIFLEVGLILALLIFIILTNLNLKPSAHSDEVNFERQELLSMEEIVQTKQPERPPLPPRPAVPVEVPNNEIIEEEVLAIDAEINFDEPLTIPPPPVKKQVVEPEQEDNFFVAVEEMPKLIGGIESIQSHIRYPEKAVLAGIDGLVIIQFIVNKEGEVESPKVIRSVGAGCDEEAIRVVRLAKFKPGKQRGQAVRVQFSVPVFFKLKS